MNIDMFNKKKVWRSGMDMFIWCKTQPKEIVLSAISIWEQGIRFEIDGVWVIASDHLEIFR